MLSLIQQSLKPCTLSHTYSIDFLPHHYEHIRPFSTKPKAIFRSKMESNNNEGTPGCIVQKS
jgi:hypothetical protein